MDPFTTPVNCPIRNYRYYCSSESNSRPDFYISSNDSVVRKLVFSDDDDNSKTCLCPSTTLYQAPLNTQNIPDDDDDDKEPKGPKVPKPIPEGYPEVDFGLSNFFGFGRNYCRYKIQRRI